LNRFAKGKYLQNRARTYEEACQVQI